jgi:hypothetical protein
MIKSQPQSVKQPIYLRNNILTDQIPERESETRSLFSAYIVKEKYIFIIIFSFEGVGL